GDTLLYQPGPHTPRTPSRRGPRIRVLTTPQPLGEERQHPRSPPPEPPPPPVFLFLHIFSAHPSGQEAPFPFPGPSSPAGSPHTHLEQLGRGGHGARGWWWWWWCWGGGSSAALRHPTTASHCVPQPRHRHHRRQQPRHRLHPPETGLRRAATAARSSRLLPGPGRHLLPCPGLPPLPAAIPVTPPPLAQRHGAAGALGAEVRPPGRRRGAFLQCDIEGAAPNVTLTLNLPTNGSPLQDILVHHCVTSVDPAMLMSSSVDPLDDSVYSGPYKFPFVPPSDAFNLCYYTSQVPVPPILGCYQLIEEGSQLKLTVNLKLHESIKNSFEYCEARIPFFNRGPIAHLEYKISYGQLDLSREKSLLVWVIGQKFPKSSEVSLTGTVTFGAAGEEHPTDYVCTGNTAYVKMYFRIPDFTLTGCYVDQHSVQIFAPGKPKITASRELISSDYYIWNSEASAPIMYKSLYY
uniref:AP-5 complex subunit mu-1 n=1 Tax=Cairina moschata TaxID=8855 RepID=A0A8C3B966_CAIMO